MSAIENLAEAEDEDGASYFDWEEFAALARVEDTHYWHLHRRAVILDELRRFVPPEACGRLVEHGVGLGTVANHLNRNGYVVDYADFFMRSLGVAERRAKEALGADANRRRFLRIDLTKELPDLGHTGVLLFDVLEHLPDDQGILERIRRALSRAGGGLVMITVPAFMALWSPWDDLAKHKRRYTRDSLEDVMRRAGFDVVRSTYFFCPLFLAAASVKGLREAKKVIDRGAPSVTRAEDLTEMKSVPLVNRAMLGVLAPELHVLRRGTLPFGTSVLAIGRAA